MNNLINTFKRFIQNKNTVTILGVIIIIAVLYFGYNNQIQKQVSPVKGIPVAKNTIPPRTLITEDMLEKIDIPPIVRQKGAITNINSVVGKYTNYNTVIPKGSLFYEDVLVRREDLPDSAFEKIKEGHVVLKMGVSTESTYGNAMFPGNKIDIYMSAVNFEGLLMFGKLFENVEIVDVKDNSGQHVFEESEGRKSPSMLIFGMDEVSANLYEKAQRLSKGSIKLFPVPLGGPSEHLGEFRVVSEVLKEFIDINTVPNPELIMPEEVEDDIPDFDDLDFLDELS